MGDAAPSGIITLVLIASESPLPEGMSGEFAGVDLAEIDPGVYAVAFDRATNALRFAIKAIRTLREDSRAAVVTHEMDLESSAEDDWAYRRARTILGGAFEGMILVSSGTREVIGRYPEDFGIMKLDRVHLPDEDRPETLYRVTHRALRSNFPRATRFSDSPNNLRSLGGAFRGRDQELDTISRLTSESRRIVLLGPAGIGKSRLAIEYGQRCAEQDFDGVWVVNLQAAVNIGEWLPTYAADSIGAPPNANLSPVERMVNRLQAQNTLLILDGCEAAPEAVCQLVPELTSQCPNLLVLLTSQVPLNIHKQVSFEVPPMSAGAHGDAVDLFIDRLGMANPDFQPSDDDRERLAEICDRLANVPMAIELVAPNYLNQSAMPRPTESPDVVVRVALDWIVADLSKTLIKLAHAAAVFRGPIHAEAMLSVAKVGKAPDLDFLAKKALLIPDGAATYRMPNAIRQYFAALDPKANALLDDKHAAWFATRAKDIGEEFDRTGDMTVFGDELENFHHALDTLCRRRNENLAFDIGFAMFDYWYRNARFDEGSVWILRVLDVATDARRLVRLKNMGASLALGAGNFKLGNQLADEGITEARRLKADDLLARLYLNSGLLLYGQENFAGALVALKESRKCCKRLAISSIIPDLYIAIVLGEMGEFRKADDMRITINLDELPPVMKPLLDLNKGISRMLEGRYEEAKEILEGSLKESHRVGDQSGARSAMRCLVVVYEHLGLLTQCARFTGASEAIGEGTYGFWPKGQRERYEAALVRARERLGDSLFEELRMEGFEAPVDRLIHEIEWKWPDPE